MIEIVIDSLQQACMQSPGCGGLGGGAISVKQEISEIAGSEFLVPVNEVGAWAGVGVRVRVRAGMGEICGRSVGDLGACALDEECAGSLVALRHGPQRYSSQREGERERCLAVDSGSSDSEEVDVLDGQVRPAWGRGGCVGVHGAAWGCVGAGFHGLGWAVGGVGGWGGWGRGAG